MQRDENGNRLYTGLNEDLAPLERMTLAEFVDTFVHMSQAGADETQEEMERRLIQRQEFGLCGRILERK